MRKICSLTVVLKGDADGQNTVSGGDKHSRFFKKIAPAELQFGQTEPVESKTRKTHNTFNHSRAHYLKKFPRKQPADFIA